MSIADVTLKQSMGREKENLTLYEIKSSRKNIGATSHKVKNKSTNPTFPLTNRREIFVEELLKTVSVWNIVSQGLNL